MKRGIGLLVLATLLWGGNYICGRFLAPALPATLLNTVRWAISTVLLAGMIRLKSGHIPVLAKWKQFAILGFLGVFAFSTLNYIGLRTISASRAGMISAGIPIAILLFTPIVLKEQIKAKAWIGAVVSIVGVILLFQGKNAAPVEGSLAGDGAIVLAALAWGLYTVLGKKYGKHMDSLTMTAGASLYGTLFSALSCIGTVRPDMIHMTAMAWVCVLYVSTLASVVAYLAWNAGVKTVGAGKAAPYINLLPVWTVVFGVVLLHEHISGMTLIGGAVAILGAILATL
ncbi:hypothetical protein SD70_00680 [Gordoniibacillus kamchatkensis]|uniref:EamA domain-containing protein n=1 Tax=Gordoniibacillus kamchatkensis TaxID=1590651 RepID=A0ABR5ANJ5_9BACL|nr:DMT family transporter [Paenibacillus sp. VKM B-2647]KIL42547.1 hypothetical protein SD70_00680 [Paenibacillus sp. VKM B-2647]